MLSGQNFLIRAYVQPAINDRQPFGGAAGQGDLAGSGVQVLARPDTHFVLTQLGFLQIPVHCQPGVAVDVSAVLLDGIPHRLWVRSHQEVGEVDVVRVLVEQLFQTDPLVC